MWSSYKLLVRIYNNIRDGYYNNHHHRPLLYIHNTHIYSTHGPIVTSTLIHHHHSTQCDRYNILAIIILVAVSYAITKRYIIP